jgi:hypothetical protein
MKRKNSKRLNIIYNLLLLKYFISVYQVKRYKIVNLFNRNLKVEGFSFIQYQ